MIKHHDSRRACAFGILNIPVKQVRDDLFRVLKKTHELRKLDCSWNRDRLRSKLARAMALDVIFSPRLIMEYENSKWSKSRLPIHRKWNISPVWRVAPKCAYIKANRLCSLLHEVVNGGYEANVLHLLVRMSIHIWTMSLGDFSGLCRKIIAKIAKVGLANYRSRPDPLLRRTLSNNPVIIDGCVYRKPMRNSHSLKDYGMRVRHAPKHLGVSASLLNRSAFAEDLKRVRILRKEGNVVRNARVVDP